MTLHPSKAARRIQESALLAEASRYHGLWHAPTQHLVGSLRCASATVSSGLPRRALMLADVRAFNAVLFDIYKLHKGGENAGILFSLDFRAFCDSDLNKDYMIALRQTPSSLLPFVTPRLVDVPAEVSVLQIADTVKQLQRLFGHVIVEATYRAPMKGLGSDRTTVALPWSAIAGQGEGRAGLQQMIEFGRQFHGAAKSADLRSMISGVDNDLALDVALEGGFDFVAGRTTGDFSQPLCSQFRLGRAAIGPGSYPEPPPQPISGAKAELTPMLERNKDRG